MAKNIFEELTGYRVKVEREGKEIVNVPGILALPALLISPKVSVIGLVAAPLLGCSVHLENDDGGKVDVEKAVKEAAGTVIDTAKTAARTIRDEVNRAWDELSADDPEECPEGMENDEEPAGEPAEEPVEESAEESAGEPAEESTEESAGEPAEKSVDQTDPREEIPTIQVNPNDSEKA